MSVWNGFYVFHQRKAFTIHCCNIKDLVGARMMHLGVAVITPAVRVRPCVCIRVWACHIHKSGGKVFAPKLTLLKREILLNGATEIEIGGRQPEKRHRDRMKSCPVEGTLKGNQQQHHPAGPCPQQGGPMPGGRRCFWAWAGGERDTWGCWRWGVFLRISPGAWKTHSCLLMLCVWYHDLSVVLPILILNV